MIGWQPKNLQPYIYTELDNASDEDDQRSISGQMSILGGMLVGWSSKKQQTVWLSSCKAKYISYGEICQEAMFMNQLLNKLLTSNTSVVVYGDNQGALYLVKNRQVSQHTKHIDICQHFVKDLQRQKKVIGWFVQSKENMADGDTKNLPDKLFMQHVEAPEGGCWR